MSIKRVNSLNTYFCLTTPEWKKERVEVLKLFCQFFFDAWTYWFFLFLINNIAYFITFYHFSDMNKRILFPVVFICYICTRVIQCYDGAPCYTGLPEHCPSADSPSDVCKCKNFDQLLFCCQVQSNEDLFANIKCSSIKLIITSYITLKLF